MNQSVKDVHGFAGAIIEERIKERIASNAGDQKANDASEQRTAEKEGRDLLDLFMDQTLDVEELRYVSSRGETVIVSFMKTFLTSSRHPNFPYHHLRVCCTS